MCLVDLARRRRDWAHAGGRLVRRPPQAPRLAIHSYPRFQPRPALRARLLPRARTPSAAPASAYSQPRLIPRRSLRSPLPCSLTSPTRVVLEPTRFPPSLGLDCVPHTGLQPPEFSTHTLFTRAHASGPRPHTSRSSHTLLLTLTTHTYYLFPTQPYPTYPTVPMLAFYLTYPTLPYPTLPAVTPVARQAGLHPPLGWVLYHPLPRTAGCSRLLSMSIRREMVHGVRNAPRRGGRQLRSISRLAVAGSIPTVCTRGNPLI